MPSIERVSPPYVQVVDYISDQIARGSIAPGDRIASERELMDTWQISKATANKVVSRLKAAGLVETRVGVGTVVSEGLPPTGIGPRDMWARIKEGGNIRLPTERSERTIDWCDASEAPVHVVEALGGTRESGNLLRRARVIYRDDVPYSVATSWFHPPLLSHAGSELIDRLAEDRAIPEGTPKFIAAALNRELDSGTDYVEAIEAAESTATTFGVRTGSPVLRIVSTLYADADFPVEVGVYEYPQGSGVTYSYEL